MLIIITNSSTKGFAGGLQSPASVTPTTKNGNIIIAYWAKENNGISKMEFTSLKQMYNNNIQSFPELTHLDLSANQIKLIELVLSYTRKGKNFYMNHTAIADRLVIKKTDNRAKTVGNIIGQLKKKGYITTIQTFNYNGKNGGSSVTLTVDEVYLEQQLRAAFNSVEVLDQNTPQAPPVFKLQPVKIQLPNANPSSSAVTESLQSNSENPKQTAAQFAAELDAMEDEPRDIPELPWLAKHETFEDESEPKEVIDDFGYKEIKTESEFKALLYYDWIKWHPSIVRCCT